MKEQIIFTAFTQPQSKLAKYYIEKGYNFKKIELVINKNKTCWKTIVEK